MVKPAESMNKIQGKPIVNKYTKKGQRLLYLYDYKIIIVLYRNYFIRGNLSLEIFPNQLLQNP